MASHFVRWSLTDANIPLHRLSRHVTEAAQTLPERRRMRFLASRMLLAETMLRLYGIPQLPALTNALNGRPRFADPDLPDFSIAYAGNIIGVLLAEEGACAGLDMEIVRAHSRQTLEQYSREISSGEKAWVQAQADPVEAATQLWTLRQSILKLTDDKAKESLRLHPASGRLRSLLLPDIEAISDVEPLIVWSCALSPGGERLSLWEFAENNWKGLSSKSMGPRTLRLTSLPPEKLAHF